MIPIWHDGDLAALSGASSGPLAWSVDLTGPAADLALSTAAPRADDLADAARRSDGAVSMARRRLARALIARLAVCHPDSVYLGRSAKGAPCVIFPQGWYLSLSGRNQRCLIGLARVPIGVDMELIGDSAVTGDPIWDMMTHAEARALRSLPASQGRREWLRRWAAKEAHAKLIGSPRRIDPACIETTPNGPDEILCEFEGRSICWNRTHDERVESMAIWAPLLQHLDAG